MNKSWKLIDRSIPHLFLGVVLEIGALLEKHVKLLRGPGKQTPDAGVVRDHQTRDTVPSLDERTFLSQGDLCQSSTHTKDDV